MSLEDEMKAAVELVREATQEFDEEEGGPEGAVSISYVTEAVFVRTTDEWVVNDDNGNGEEPGNTTIEVKSYTFDEDSFDKDANAVEIAEHILTELGYE